MKAARKNKISKEELNNRHYCIECMFAQDDMKFINLDINGKPFMLRCPFTKWKRFHNDLICDRFIPKILNN